MEEKNRGGIPIQPVLSSNGQTSAEPSAAFTPGPWQAFLGSGGSFTVLGHHGSEPPSPIVCERIGAFAMSSAVMRRRHADARLIAAAPELYEVCREFIGKLGRDGYYPTAGKPLTDKMRAAIAKAEAYNAS